MSQEIKKKSREKKTSFLRKTSPYWKKGKWYLENKKSGSWGLPEGVRSKENITYFPILCVFGSLSSVTWLPLRS